MAGQPKKRAMIEELERRTREEFGVASTETHVDYALEWVASGGTVFSLAESIAGAKGIKLMRSTLDKYLRDLEPEWVSKSRDARARGSHSMVEQAAALADTADTMDKDRVPGAKLKIDSKLKVAAMFNREEFGERKGNTLVVNVANLHLDAMRRRKLPSAIARAIPEEAEVLSIEESTS